jgi:hypothetical protein
MSHSSLRTAAPPPCLPQNIKDSLKEDTRLFDEGFFAEGRIPGGRLLKGENELLKGAVLKGNC